MKTTISMFVLLAAATVSQVSVAAPVGDCAGTPPEAVVELPPPLNSWGQIACTPYGHILTNKEGWVWSNPGSYSPVFVPSQMVRDRPEEVGNKSYFKRIAMVKVSGAEFESAYGAFHTGLDKDEAIPVGYRLDATSVSGKSLKLYFFDYGSSAWGIWCRETCAADSRFMLLNMAQRPNKAFNPTASPSASPRVN